MNNLRDIITVDGLAASGKSALAKELAKRLGFGHLNSGLLYRAVAFAVLSEGRDLLNGDAVLEVMGRHSIELTKEPGNSSLVVLLDGVVRTDELLSKEVSLGASQVARHQGVRDLLLDLQRQAFGSSGVVAEGRDMGTVIFPDARVKFFVTARLDIRAARRFSQLKDTPERATLEDIKAELEQRDNRDASSAVGTMKQAQGAIVVDNSDEPFGKVVAKMEQAITSVPQSQN